MAQLKLVSLTVCPYVQRAIIVLVEKGLPYEVEYVDIWNKPSWFVETSPLGKVPLLIVDDAVLFESSVINEYLNEVTPAPNLHPADTLERAQNRVWIEFLSQALSVQYWLQLEVEEEKMRALAADLRARMERLEQVLGPGPYFNGDWFSLTDAAAAPLFQRMEWLESFSPGLGILDGLDKAQTWSAALRARDSVKQSGPADLRELYRAYICGGGSPHRNVEPSWIGRQTMA